MSTLDYVFPDNLAQANGRIMIRPNGCASRFWASATD